MTETTATVEQSVDTHEKGVYKCHTGLIAVFFSDKLKQWMYRKVEGRKSKRFLSARSWPMCDWMWERCVKQEDALITSFGGD